MRIGIIGASSQVGSSLAFFFKKFTTEQITCFIRSSYSDIFFDILEIPYKQININNKKELKEILKDFDVIVDFTYPTGQIYSIPQTIKNNIANIISSMPTDSVYIYMSSIMAFGMPSDRKYVKDFFISRTAYGYIKRLAEKATKKFGKRYHVRTYNFRLGQVHGFLQSVNSSFREKLTQEKVAYIDGNPYELTNTIFISSIASAIIKCTKNIEVPGTYTLVSNPQWTLEELYNYYRDYYNINTFIEFIPAEAAPKKLSIRKFIFNILKSFRYLLEIYVLMKLPFVSLKVKGKYREKTVRDIISEKDAVKYIDFNFLGSTPDEKISEIDSEKHTIFNIERECDAFYNEIIIKKTV